MQRFDSIIQELQNNMQDMPSEGLRSKILSNANASVTPPAIRRQFYAYPLLMAAIVLVFVCTTVYTAYAAGAFENLRRFERHPSHLDETPIPVCRGDEIIFCEETFVYIGDGFMANEKGEIIFCEETYIYIGDGIFVNMEWREFQYRLQEYGWQRINAGQSLDGRVPEELWCFCGGPIYMRHSNSTVSAYNDTKEWAREGWVWHAGSSRGYISDDGTEYIEMERWVHLSFICPECDLYDTARYSILFKEYKWMQLSTLDNPYIWIDSHHIVDER